MSEIFGAIKLKNKITIASSMLVFAVVLIAITGILSFVTADRHTHIYNYGLEMTDNGSFNLVGVCTVDNCESPFYKETNISGVKIFTAKSPTCSGEGNIVYTYTVGDVTVKYTQKLPVAAHTYDLEIVNEGQYTKFEGMCTADGCTDPHILVTNAGDFKPVSSVPGNCFSPRQDTYSYVVDGVEKSLVTLVDEQIPHTLGGVSADSYKDENGNYAIGTSGIKLVENKPIACGASANGYYVCEACKQVIGVKVVREEHKFVYSEAGVTAPTVNTNGSVVLGCHNSECSEVVTILLPAVNAENNSFVTVISHATEISPTLVSYSFESLEYGFKFEKEYAIGQALTHNYVYTLEPNKNNTGKMDLHGVCNQPECKEPNICIENVPAEFVDDTSTCQTPGTVTWKYEYQGEVIWFIAPSLEKSGHSYDYKTDSPTLIRPTLDQEGEIELYCTTEGCTETLLIKLPKAVIDENAVFFGFDEESGENVYRYTYDTKKNCIVKLLIVLNEEQN